MWLLPINQFKMKGITLIFELDKRIYMARFLKAIKCRKTKIVWINPWRVLQWGLTYRGLWADNGFRLKLSLESPRGYETSLFKHHLKQKNGFID